MFGAEWLDKDSCIESFSGFIESLLALGLWKDRCIKTVEIEKTGLFYSCTVIYVVNYRRMEMWQVQWKGS